MPVTITGVGWVIGRGWKKVHLFQFAEEHCLPCEVTAGQHVTIPIALDAQRAKNLYEKLSSANDPRLKTLKGHVFTPLSTVGVKPDSSVSRYLREHGK